MICVVCKAPMEPDAIPDTYKCFGCGFYASSLPVKINEINRYRRNYREMALKPLRSKTFSKILEASQIFFPRTRVCSMSAALMAGSWTR